MNKIHDKQLVSVVIPTYNNEEELKKTVESVLSQTYSTLEIIIADDGSDKDLQPAINGFNDKRISYYKMPHANANVARNFGIKKSKGTYIAMLDSRDCWKKEHVEECVNLLAESKTDGLYSSLICCMGEQKRICLARELTEGETMAEYLISTGCGAQTSTLFTTAVGMKDILWDENLNRHQDYDFVIRYCRKYKMILKEFPTVIHTVEAKKSYDFVACIRFINQYKSEITDKTLNSYYRGMLLLARDCNASENTIEFYISELNRLNRMNQPQDYPENVVISIIMPVCNVETHITETIESVLKQSFTDFELILIDNGSTDATLPFIRSFSDQRMIVLQIQTNWAEAFNTGLQKARGKYIVEMEASHIMHIDRLKIQHAIMEEEPDITVCGTWILPFGNQIGQNRIIQNENGLIEFPVLTLLKGNFLHHSTTMIRKDFLDCHHLQYENYACAEDYKFWYEIAKRKGIFYIESQPLLYYRVSETQIGKSKKDEQEVTKQRIRQEILEYLIEQNQANTPELTDMYQAVLSLKAKNLFTQEDLFSFFYTFFMENKLTLKS